MGILAYSPYLIGVLALAILIFTITKSIIFRLVGICVTVLVVILVASVFIEDRNNTGTQVSVVDNYLSVTQDGKSRSFRLESLKSVTATEHSDGGVKVVYVVDGEIFEVKVSNFFYEWKFRNVLNDKFPNAFRDLVK